MRRVIVDRSTLEGVHLELPGGSTSSGAEVISLLDDLGVPDGFPFFIEDNGLLDGVSSLNRYLLEAWSQGAYSLRSLRRFHSYNLARLLMHVRFRRASLQAEGAGQPIDGSVSESGLPSVDLLSADRDDLVSYRDERCEGIKPGSWNTELGSISGFFDWAVQSGLISRNPIPRWGTRRRNTLAVRDRYERQVRFLTVPQLTHFLEHGLRCDGAISPKQYRERNYAFGLLLATTGLRREEGGLLLDCEIPHLSQMPSNGVWPFTRVGKGRVPRTVFVTTELVSGIDIYRQVTRDQTVRSAQGRLRKERDSGRLLMCDDLAQRADGTPVLHFGRRRVPVDRLSEQDRSRVARITDEGMIEPLALFVSRFGMPLDIDTWDLVFADARALVHQSASPHRPPAHLTVSPHVFRHTYAVRMLSALMRVGRDRSQDPYLLLANPVLTVMSLLGHADVGTTQRYLYAAETYSDELPNALREVSAATLSASEVSGGGAPTDD